MMLLVRSRDLALFALCGFQKLGPPLCWGVPIVKTLVLFWSMLGSPSYYYVSEDYCVSDDAG